MLWPADVPFDDSAIRRANLGQWAVAWDVPGEPGHDGLNFPCAECGRGVIGFSELGTGSGTGSPKPYRVVYDDGSTVEIGFYAGSDEIPADVLQFEAVDTGEPIDGGWQANVHWSETGETYIIWSHLGRDHLLSLVESLRVAETP